jgi:hypothetical protein
MAAEEKLLDERVKANHSLPKAITTAEDELDAAARKVLGVPPTAFLRVVRPSHFEVYGCVHGAVLASALDEGHGRWAVAPRPRPSSSATPPQRASRCGRSPRRCRHR